MNKKIIILIFICLFIGLNTVIADEIYCEPEYEMYTDSSGNQKCRKKIGNPFKEYNQWHCTTGFLMDGACYSIKDPLIDGCESGYESYTDSEGNRKCKKKVNNSDEIKLIETFCYYNRSCTYLKSPVPAEMKCESGYEMYTDSNGNQKCKKKIGNTVKEFGMTYCISGTKMDGACYSVKDPLKEGGGCESGYELYTNSSNIQMCKKKLDDSQRNTLMQEVCKIDSSECSYIKDIVEKEEPSLPKPSPGENVYGCEVIPEEIREWILDALDLVKYICLALVIVLGILDFIKAAASGEADAMKKSGQSFLKRVIAVVILFLLPVLVELILSLIEIYGVNPDNPLCTK